MKPALAAVLFAACAGPLELGGIKADYATGTGRVIVKLGKLHQPDRAVVDRAVSFAFDFWARIYPDAVARLLGEKYLLMYRDDLKLAYRHGSSWRYVSELNNWNYALIRRRLAPDGSTDAAASYSLTVHALSHAVLERVKGLCPPLAREKCEHGEMTKRGLGH